jgi:hypothetical protein
MILKLLTMSLFMALGVLTSCTNTIEDASLLPNLNKDFKSSSIIFFGAEEAVPTAHNKVTLKFLPATGALNFSYFAYLNGNFTSTILTNPDFSLHKDSFGYYHMDITNLAQNQGYWFSVRAYDLFSEETDTNKVLAAATTLNTVVPTFSGVSTAVPEPGIEGETKVRVSWNAAQSAGTAIAGYKVNIATSEADVLNETNVTTYTTNQTYLVISGLTANTNYYVRVQAQDINNNFEQNIKVKHVRTRGVTPITFDGISTIAWNPILPYFSQLRITFPEAQGSFDRYVFCYKVQVQASYDCTTVIGQNDARFNSREILLNTIEKFKTYQMQIYALNTDCQNDCVNAPDRKPALTFNTTPPYPTFSGLNSFATQDVKRNSIRLSWQNSIAPASGYANTIKIYRKIASDGITSFNATEILAAANLVSTLSINNTTGQLSSLEFTDSFTGIDSVDYLNKNICYVMQITQEDNSNIVVNQQVTGLVRCGVPLWVSPSVPVLGCTANHSASVTCTWTMNTFGEFESFRLWYQIAADAETNPLQSLPNNEYTDPCTNTAGQMKGCLDQSKSICNSSNICSFTFTPSNTHNQLAPQTFFALKVIPFFESQHLHIESSQNWRTIQMPSLKAIWKGFTQIIAYGAKVHGPLSTDSDLVILPEMLSAHNVIDRFIPLEVKATNNYSDPACLAASPRTCSRSGIVHLAWEESELPGVDQSLLSYRVFRTVSPTPTAPTLSVSAPSGQWLELPVGNINKISGLSIPGLTVNQSITRTEWHLADHSIPEQAAAIDKREEARTFWYAIVPVYQTGTLGFSDTKNFQEVKVIVPPVNKVFNHRFAMNRVFCERHLAKSANLQNNYSCPYNGVGNISGLFDMQKHRIWSRFEAGAKPTANCGQVTNNEASGAHAGSQNRCYDYGAEDPRPRCLLAYTWPENLGQNQAICHIAHNQTSGNVGVTQPPMPNDRNPAGQNTNRSVLTPGEWALAVSSGALYPISYKSSSNSSWKVLTSFQKGSFNPGMNGDEFNVLNNFFNQSRNFSDDALNAVINNVSPSFANSFCEKINIRVNNTPLSMRLPGRIEQNIAFTPSPLISSLNLAHNNGSNLLSGCLNKELWQGDNPANFHFRTYFKTHQVHNNFLQFSGDIQQSDIYDRAAYSYNSVSRSTNLLRIKSGTSSTYIDLVAPPSASIRQISTERCISFFGLQDFISNVSEWATLPIDNLSQNFVAQPPSFNDLILNQTTHDHTWLSLSRTQDLSGLTLNGYFTTVFDDSISSFYNAIPWYSSVPGGFNASAKRFNQFPILPIDIDGSNSLIYSKSLGAFFTADISSPLLDSDSDDIIPSVVPLAGASQFAVFMNHRQNWDFNNYTHILGGGAATDNRMYSSTANSETLNTLGNQTIMYDHSDSSLSVLRHPSGHPEIVASGSLSPVSNSFHQSLSGSALDTMNGGFRCILEVD